MYLLVFSDEQNMITNSYPNQSKTQEEINNKAVF